MTEWIDVRDRLPEAGEFVLVIVNGKNKNITFKNALELAEHTEEGWHLEAFPEFPDPQISHWMPLPDPPEMESGVKK